MNMFFGQPDLTTRDFILDKYSVRFVAEEDGSTIKITKNEPNSEYLLSALHLEYSTSDNFGVWTEYSLDNTITLANEGDFVCFRATADGNTKFARIGSRNATPLNNNFYHFVMSGKIASYGNIMTLINKNPAEAVMQELPETDNNPSNVYGTFTFFGLFYQCSALTKAPSLPAMDLATHCYDCMFRECTSLKEMPELPASNLVVCCYMHMFNGCTALINTKKIYASKADEGACYGMFWNCGNLEEANILDDCEFEYAKTFAFRYMFYNCNSIRKGTSMIVNGKVGHATCNSVYHTPETALTSVPKIHIDEIENRSGLYGAMFKGCKYLLSVPLDYLKNSASVISSNLSAWNSTEPGVVSSDIATSINIKDIYATMFESCTSLTSAPFLYECALSTRIYKTAGQYNSIFKGCSMLSTVYTDFSDYSRVSANFTSASILSCAQEGTLYCKNYAALSSYEAKLVPSGWRLAELPEGFAIP